MPPKENRANGLNRRANLKKEYGRLFDAVSEVLFRHDPMGINFGGNSDEYDPEVGTILPKLKHCNSKAEVLDVVYNEFQRWFNDSAGKKQDYRAISEEIWLLWQTGKSI